MKRATPTHHWVRPRDNSRPKTRVAKLANCIELQYNNYVVLLYAMCAVIGYDAVVA